MGQFNIDERILESSVTTGTGEYTLAGADTGFQPASVIGANNYGPFFIVADPLDANWEAILGTFITGPNRLQRTHVKASSNGGAAVNWGAGTKKIRCGWPAWLAAPSVVTKSVAGGTDVTLTAAEQRCDILILIGALTANINVIVDTTPWLWILYNNTSGAYTATLKTSAGTGIAVTQGKRSALHCDGTNVQRAVDEALTASGGTLTGDLTLTGASIIEAEGAAVASAATTNIWATDGNTVHITGTTTITSFGTAPQAGAWMKVIFDGALTLTHGANLSLPGSANITTAADDFAFVYADTTTQFDVVYFKKDGTAVVPVAAASQAEQETGSSTAVYVSPGRQHFHPSAMKLWGSCGIAGDLGSPSYNVTSVGDTGVGRVTVTVATDFSSAVYAIDATLVIGAATTTIGGVKTSSPAAGSFELHAMGATTGTATDPSAYHFSAAGDQA